MSDFFRQLDISCTECVAVNAAGMKMQIRGIEDCFVSFRHSESKGVPYNTAVYKRRKREYARPRLINRYDGDIIIDDVVEFIVA